ncbi:MAG: hypothetical protein WD988_01405 [Candidatus Curtissbacteria bacterium]
MVRKNATYLFFVLLGAFLVILALNSQNKLSLENVVPSSVSDAPVVSGGKIDLPVDMNNPFVSNLYLAYNFFGNVGSIENLPQGSQIILEGETEGLPEFVVAEKTVQVFKVDGNQSITPAGINDLKVGSQISISTTYDARAGVWVTRTVHILN